MFERFTDGARRVIVAAQQEARSLNHQHIGTEHILLGLFSIEGDARTLIGTTGLTLEEARAEVLQAVPKKDEAPRGHIPFTPRAKRVLEFALRESVRARSGEITAGYLLLALLREGDGVAAQILARRGLTLDHARVNLTGTTAAPEEDVAIGQGSPIHVEYSRGGVAQLEFAEGALSPQCPRCRAALVETAAYKIIDVPEDGGSGTLKLCVVFCEACGRMLSSRIVANPQEPPAE